MAHDLSLTYSRFDHMSPSGVALATLLHVRGRAGLLVGLAAAPHRSDTPIPSRSRWSRRPRRRRAPPPAASGAGAHADPRPEPPRHHRRRHSPQPQTPPSADGFERADRHDDGSERAAQGAGHQLGQAGCQRCRRTTAPGAEARAAEGGRDDPAEGDREARAGTGSSEGRAGEGGGESRTGPSEGRNRPRTAEARTTAGRPRPGSRPACSSPPPPSLEKALPPLEAPPPPVTSREIPRPRPAASTSPPPKPQPQPQPAPRAQTAAAASAGGAPAAAVVTALPAAADTSTGRTSTGVAAGALLGVHQSRGRLWAAQGAGRLCLERRPEDLHASLLCARKQRRRARRGAGHDRPRWPVGRRRHQQIERLQDARQCDAPWSSTLPAPTRRCRTMCLAIGTHSSCRSTTGATINSRLLKPIAWPPARTARRTGSP